MCEQYARCRSRVNYYLNADFCRHANRVCATVVTMNPTNLLRKMCAKRPQVAVAAELGVSPQYLNDVLNERRDPGDSILAPLGLERVVTYRRRKAPTEALATPSNP